MNEPSPRHRGAAVEEWAGEGRGAEPGRWYTTNLVGLPVGLLGSPAFNAHPQPITIAGVRETHRGLFRLLDSAGDLPAASAVFRHFMEIVFGLAPPEPGASRNPRGRHRSSYLKLLQGWGLDANSAAGAVLKGWAESRFGLVPTFHKAPLGRFPSPAWITYIEEKGSSRFHNNCIHQQLDLLYEYCQWAIARFGQPARDFLTLWRGVNDFNEQRVIAGDRRDRACVLRLNNMVSFSTSRERADEFGDWILEARVPTVKILFFPGLLPGAPLAGEGEVLVIGGEYEVVARYA
ncbi:MAG: NAD(+)--dinitrogen-reductase ADP-D-ribosyltransferase [Zoogloea sp.]|nr:NAD(+)--dinitrogen-reductase ADP-D-ribosyltransferase [Zoogloea sp.]MCA0186136.1 NAD(+)--dinitrogen-reductase ADP-D-ribosyltransferase [Pseudomonadota bacterium]